MAKRPKSMREIEKAIPAVLVAAAEDAFSRRVFGTMMEANGLARMRGALAAYEYEKQLLAASRINHPVAGEASGVDASEPAA